MKVERDFKLVCTGGPYGDCCCSYAVELRGEWTVQELVKAVLERNPCEWGFFYIQRAGQMDDEALAFIIMCPRDDGNKCKNCGDVITCIACCLDWLRESAEG